MFWELDQRYQRLPKRNEDRPKGGRAALEAPGLTDPEAFPHQEAKIETGEVDEEPFGNVPVMAIETCRSYEPRPSWDATFP